VLSLEVSKFQQQQFEITAE